MKILLLYNTLDFPESQLVRELDQSGSDFQLDVMASPESGNREVFRGSSVSFEPFVCRNRLDMVAVRTLRKKIAAKKYDIIHAFTSKTLSAALLATIGIKNSPKILAYRGAMGNVSRLDPTSWLTYLNPKVCKINCVSDAVKNYLSVQGIPESKLVRIYKGHRVSWYEQSAADSRQALGIPENSFVVGCVANMRPNKGVDLLLEAAIELSDQRDFHYLLVGNLQHKRLTALFQDERIKKNLRITGPRDDAPFLMRHCDTFVMPSRFSEGLPKAVIEAMSHGVPPIVSDVGGMPELVRHEKDGLVVPAQDPTALAQAISRLHEDTELRNFLGASARDRIRTAFNIEDTVRETASLYREAVAA